MADKASDARTAAFKKVLTATIIFLAVVFIFLLVQSKFKTPKTDDETRIAEVEPKPEITEEIKLPAEEEKPEFTFAELERMANDPNSEVYKSWEKQLPRFDEEKEKVAICQELGISPKVRREPEFTIDQLEAKAQEKIGAQIATEIRKQTTAFNKDAAKKEIAQNLGITLPVKQPEKTIKAIKRDLLREAVKKAAKKYPSSLIAKQEKEIKKKYKAYKEGDRVTVNDRHGLNVTGTYQGRNGTHIRIGGKDFTFS